MKETYIITVVINVKRQCLMKTIKRYEEYILLKPKGYPQILLFYKHTKPLSPILEPSLQEVLATTLVEPSNNLMRDDM